jgi:hypothetical protein
VQVEELATIQEKVYDEPTVLLAQHVSGEEEIPEGVVAVLTPDAPDLLSHSSVRARNMKVRRSHCVGRSYASGIVCDGDADIRRAGYAAHWKSEHARRAALRTSHALHAMLDTVPMPPLSCNSAAPRVAGAARHVP